MKTHQIFLSILIAIVLTFSAAKSQNITSKTSNSSITAPIRYIKVDSLRIAYKVIGKGKPVIFLQRFRGTLNDWDPGFIDAVASKFQVILFDAPGVGLSSGAVPTSITTMANQAVQISDALGIRKATFVGWSMGGAIAQAVAINHPERIEKLVLLATGPSSNPEFVAGNPEFGIRARKPVYEFDDNQFLFFYQSATSKAACEAYLKRLNSIKEKDVETRPESYKNMTVALGDFKANKERDYFAELKNIKQPVLIANGKFDPSYPFINSYVLAREIPDSKLVIYPDAGHGFLFQYPTDFANELISFLTSSTGHQ